MSEYAFHDISPGFESMKQFETNPDLNNESRSQVFLTRGQQNNVITYPSPLPNICKGRKEDKKMGYAGITTYESHFL